MAGKINPMSQIKQLLLLHQQGKKIKFIAHTLGMSKNTVKSYLFKIVELKLTPEHMLSLEDPALELLFSSGNPAYKDERFEYIKSQLDYYQAQIKHHWMEKPKPLTTTSQNILSIVIQTYVIVRKLFILITNRSAKYGQEIRNLHIVQYINNIQYKYNTIQGHL